MPPKKAAPEPSNVVRFGRVRNNLKMGIVGLPNVGKSSLFNLLCEQSVNAENFPFCTIEPNESRCPVPDDRYQFLCDLWNPPSKYPAYLHVTDIAGLIKGAAEGAGLGNNFLSHIQAVDGIYHVIRAFESDDVIHVDDSIDPIRDLETIQSELCKKDLEFVLKAEEAETTAVRKSGGRMKLSPVFIEAFAKMKKLLEDNIPIRMGEYSTSEIELINEKCSLITTKPVVYLVNLSQNVVVLMLRTLFGRRISGFLKSTRGGVMIPFSIEFEQELWNLREDKDALDNFLKEHSGAVSQLPKMIRTGYSELNLIGFITAGETEVRRWTIVDGTLAPQAAGVIHSDFERGFIKAEVVAFEDFKALCGGQRSMAPIKAAGKYRIEGKTYKVCDADIVHFQFNVTTKGK